MNTTPAANRTHITLFGKRNAGKSTLFNALIGQDAALVSPVAGTTTDPVGRAMEFWPIGPVLLTDTAGLDDEGALGEARVKKTRGIIAKTDLALIVISGGETPPADFIKTLDSERIPYLIVRNAREFDSVLPANVNEITVNAMTGQGLESLRSALAAKAPQINEPPLTAHLVKRGDIVMLVMPQDSQAPKSRLILPQQQVIRDLLDNGCTAVSATTDSLPSALAALSRCPDLIITDSQAFKTVYGILPEDARLTSFSLLLARAKGDIELLLEGAKAIDGLRPGDNVLIAEACSHNPRDGDIGREKIPAMLAKYAGGTMKITVTAGSDYPADLTPYKLIIHCGGCMFNRRHGASRRARAKEQGVPVTNYGVAIAKMQGILEKVII